VRYRKGESFSYLNCGYKHPSYSYIYHQPAKMQEKSKTYWQSSTVICKDMPMESERQNCSRKRRVAEETKSDKQRKQAQRGSWKEIERDLSPL